MADWDENSPQLQENLAAALGEALTQARRGDAPSIELARSWQQRIMHRLDVPDVKYVGRFRGEPGLEHCQVRVGAKPGVQPSQVAAELGSFEQTLRRAT